MDQPAPHQKFAFDTEFFEVVGGVRTAAAPIAAGQPRTAEAQRQKAYEEGFAAGLTEGQQQAQADLARLQQHLQTSLHAMQQAAQAREATLQSHLLTLLGASVHHLLGHAAVHYASDLLHTHIEALMKLAKTDEALTLRIHPSARGYHEKLGLSHTHMLGIPLRVVPDSSLGPVDALVEWANGGVEARLSDHNAAVQALLVQAGAAPMPAAALPVISATPAPPAVAPEAAAVPAAAPPPNLVQDAFDTAQAERTARAAALLGDDELVDALK